MQQLQAWLDVSLHARLLVIAERFCATHDCVDDGTGLAPRVRASIERARRYELSLDADITAFVLLGLALGEHFSDYPPISSVLTNSTIHADERLTVLLQVMQAGDWHEAKQRAKIPGSR
jgi:hypothetical protein